MKENFNKIFDHTILKPPATSADLKKVCDDAVKYGFCSVAVNTGMVSKCAKYLSGTGVPVDAAVGFPLGITTVELKSEETREAIRNGAGEIDYVVNLTKDIKGRKEYFSSKRVSDCYYKDGAIYFENEKIIDTNDIVIKGMHNYENIMCAILVMKELNIPNKYIIEELETFKGVEHRIEYVKELNGRKFYNDSKATNTVSTRIALDSFNTPVILFPFT